MKKIFLAVLIIVFVCPIFSFAADQAFREVTFEWDATTDTTVKGYYIYRSTESGVYGDPLNEEMITATTYKDNVPIPHEQNFYYVVKATNGIFNSDPSNEVVLSKPTKPENLKVPVFINIENSSVTINNN
jgi:hypothetical protein